MARQQNRLYDALRQGADALKEIQKEVGCMETNLLLNQSPSNIVGFTLCLAIKCVINEDFTQECPTELVATSMHELYSVCLL